MLFKAIALFFIFFLIRNAYRSWLLFQKLQDQKLKKDKSKNSPKYSKDDVIDAEYTTLDK